LALGSRTLGVGEALLPRLLLDTHVLIRWLGDTKKLSRVQLRTLDSAVQRGEALTFSAVSLVEIAILASGERPPVKISLDEFFEDLNANPLFRVLPLTYEVAREVGWLAALRDPADRAIVATARVHRLRLVTSDERIIESGLVQVVD
jgi:PIN domain nuclease of toxin-antitoxin system